MPKIKSERKEVKIEEVNKQDIEMIDSKDLEYLFQDIIRKPDLDQELKEDLQTKRTNSKFLDMLVRTSTSPAIMA